jgi:glutaconate CoA-transferase subunit A
MSKIVPLSKALAVLKDGMTLSTGGWVFAGQPIALIAEVLRRKARHLHLIPAPSSLAADLLIGAGCVSRLSAMFISFEQFGLAPQFRRAAENGDIEILEFDGPGLAAGLRAGMCDLPYELVPDFGCDVPRVNPAAYVPVPVGEGERRMFRVPAIKPDVVLLHGQRADPLGNIQYDGPAFWDPMLAMAARHVIVSVDEIVSTDEIVSSNHLTRIAAPFVDAVVAAPGGARPTASGLNYSIDESELRDYARSCGAPEAFAAYVSRLLGVTDNFCL